MQAQSAAGAADGDAAAAGGDATVIGGKESVDCSARDLWPSDDMWSMTTELPIASLWESPIPSPSILASVAF